MGRRAGLSKSKLTYFEQCPKRLWLSVNQPDLAIIDEAAAARMAAGHEVGAVACALLPDGYMVQATPDLSAAVEETKALLASGWRQPLFEATFVHEDVLVRVDLMAPQGEGWHLAEVKSTTGVKDYHLGDLATQFWVTRGCGLNVTSASIRHIDKTFVLKLEGDYDGLFIDSFRESDIQPLVDGRGTVVAAARDVLAGGEPERGVGDHCDDPFECPFKGYCGRDLPSGPDWPVTLLPDAPGKKLAREWLARGVDDLLEVPADAMPNDKLARIHAATVSATPWHDHEALAAETSAWPYPLTFLDFETIQFAVPRWVGTRPYQQIPFQFSAHVVEADGSVRHQAFLTVDGEDPRRRCAQALALLSTGEGAIVAWHMSFEKGCLLALADEFSDLAPTLRDMADRLVDLLPVVRRHYYHRDMRGSWSIKSVLPTVAADLGYDTLSDVKSGTDAQAGYLEATHTETSSERRSQIEQALLDYCRRDTEAMMVVMERLSKPKAELAVQAS